MVGVFVWKVLEPLRLCLLIVVRLLYIEKFDKKWMMEVLLLLFLLLNPAVPFLNHLKPSYVFVKWMCNYTLWKKVK